MIPHARSEKLLIQKVGDELVIYDQERHRAHRLNRTATTIWHHCDGKTDVAGITALLEGEFPSPVTQDVVWLALGQLEKKQLLSGPLSRPGDCISLTRRQVIHKLGLIGTFTLLLPVVTSIVAPTLASAQSGITRFTCGVGMGCSGTCPGGGTCTSLTGGGCGCR